MTDLTSYKRVIKLFAALVILLIEIFSYWFIWITYVNKAIEFPYWRRGNWLIIAIYAFCLILFLFSYGGLKLGYLKTGNLIYSNILLTPKTTDGIFSSQKDNIFIKLTHS